MDIDLFVSILTVTVQAGTSLVFAAIGEILTERSGVLNLGLEGIMVMGALSAFAASHPEGDQLFFWFDCFSIDEHATQAMPQEWWSTAFKAQ